MKILKILPLIGLALLAYIIYKIGLINLYKTLITINLYYLFIAFIFSILAVLVLTFKWQMILRIQNINIGFLYAVKIYLIGLFYGTITPARAGSILRASYLKEKMNKSFGECVSSIILERGMDLIALFILATISCIVFSKHIFSWFPVIVVLLIMVSLCLIFVLKQNMNKFFLKLIYTFLIPDKFKEKTKEVYDGFYSNIPPFKKLILPFIVTLITWGFIAFPTFFITKSYSVNINFFYISLIFATSTVVSLIPITISGLGTREATMILLFSLFNVSAAKVMSISFVGLLLSGIILPFIGFLFSLKEQPEKLV